MFVLLSHINDWTKITKLISLEYLCSVSSFVLTTLSCSLGLHIFLIPCFFKPFKVQRSESHVAFTCLQECRTTFGIEIQATFFPSTFNPSFLPSISHKHNFLFFSVTGFYCQPHIISCFVCIRPYTSFLFQGYRCGCY